MKCEFEVTQERTATPSGRRCEFEVTWEVDVVGHYDDVPNADPIGPVKCGMRFETEEDADAYIAALEMRGLVGTKSRLK